MRIDTKQLIDNLKRLKAVAKSVTIAADGTMSARGDTGTVAQIGKPRIPEQTQPDSRERSLCGACCTGMSKRVPQKPSDTKGVMVEIAPLLKLLGAYRGELDVDVDGERLLIGSAGTYPLTPVPGAAVELDRPEDVFGDYFSIDGNRLAQHLALTGFAASKDPTRPMLQGVHIGSDVNGERPFTVATDTYRIMVVHSGPMEGTSGNGGATDVPLNILQDAAKRGGQWEFAWDDKRGSIECDGYRATYLRDGQYPPYGKCISAPSDDVTVIGADAVKLWASYCRHMLAVETVNVHRCALEHGADGLTLRFSPDDKWNDELCYTVPVLRAATNAPAIAVNAKYMLDMLSRCDADLSLSLREELNPLRFDWVARNGLRATYVLMPMQMM